MYDYVFRNALLVDGSGNKPFRADVAVYSSLICLIAPSGSLSARHVIEKPSLVLSPGFIDIHSHDDLEVLRRPELRDKVSQGITLDVNGNCGVGLFPLKDDENVLYETVVDILGAYDGRWDWKDYRSYRERIERTGAGINVGFLTSHSALRFYAMGDDIARAATPEEIEMMCLLLDEQLKEGSLGFSTGLYYSPCLFADDAEMLALLKVVKENGGLFSVHHRCEGDDLVPSLKEVLSLAERTGVRLEISHFKAIGERNQAKVDDALSLIEEYRAGGADVGFDQYPYEYGSTGLFSLLPPPLQGLTRIEQRLAVSLENEREDIKREMLSPTGWDSIYSLSGPDRIKILTLDGHRELEGMTLSEIGEEWRMDPLDALLDILSDETGKAVMMDITESRDNLVKIMRHPLSSFGTDSLFSSDTPHPRTKDAAMHLIREYVSKEKVLSLQEAVRKMSGENADRLNLNDRGYVKEGMKADLVLFDAEKGVVDTVLVNGKAVIRDGIYSGGLHGSVVSRGR